MIRRNTQSLSGIYVSASATETLDAKVRDLNVKVVLRKNIVNLDSRADANLLIDELSQMCSWLKEQFG